MPLELRHSTISLFADDSKCYRRITKVQNCQELQDDINHLFKWSVEWGMSFKIEKCFVLSINQSNQHQPFKYTMNDVTLSTVNEVKDLGIFLDTKLSWDKHIRYTTANARKVDRFNQTNCRSLSTCKCLTTTLQFYCYAPTLCMLHQYGTPFRNLRYRHWNEFRDLILNLCSVMNPHLPTRIASIDLICFLYHTDEIFQTSVSYTNLFKILAHYLQTVYILEMTSNVLDNLNQQIFQYHDVKMSNLENFILTELYIVGTSFPRVLKMQAHYLVLRKA